jgi:hypothetical protein
MMSPARKAKRAGVEVLMVASFDARVCSVHGIGRRAKGMPTLASLDLAIMGFF